MKVKVSDIATQTAIKWGLIIMGVIVIMLIIKHWRKKSRREEAQKADSTIKAATNNVNAFDPNYWKNVSPGSLLDTATLAEIVNKLDDKYGPHWYNTMWGSNVSYFQGEMSLLSNQAQVSQVINGYTAKNGRSLLNDVNESELLGAADRDDIFKSIMNNLSNLPAQ